MFIVCIQEFVSSTTITTIESVSQDLNKTTFPSIIVCNENRVGTQALCQFSFFYLSSIVMVKLI